MFELIELHVVIVKTENTFALAPLEHMEQKAKQELNVGLRHWSIWSKKLNKHRFCFCAIGAAGAVRQGAPYLLHGCSKGGKKLQVAYFTELYKKCSNAPYSLYRIILGFFNISFIGSFYTHARGVGALAQNGNSMVAA